MIKIELIPDQETGIFYANLPVTTHIDGKNWFEYFLAKKVNVTSIAKTILLENFIASMNKVYSIALIPKRFFDVSSFSATMDQYNLDWSNPEIMCLLQKHVPFQDLKDHGISWMVSVQKEQMDSLYIGSYNRAPNVAALNCYTGSFVPGDYMVFQCK